MRRIILICVCALGLSGSSAAQTQVAFLAAGDYGVGGTPERSLGLRMQSFEAANSANMLVLLGDNDYTQSPTSFRTNWRDDLRLGPPDGPAGLGRAREPRLRDRPRPLRALAARDAGPVLHAETRRRAALLPRLELGERPADHLARAAARGLDRDLEDRRLPPSAVHLRGPLGQHGRREALGAAVRELRRPARALGA